VDTGLIPPMFKTKLIDGGMEFAEIEDCVKAILKVATDKTVNGKPFASFNFRQDIDRSPGRSVGVVGKKRNAEGYMDLDCDDYQEDDTMYPFEQMALNLPKF